MSPRSQILASQVQTFFFNENETSKDLERGEQVQNVPSTPKYQTFKSRPTLSTRRKHLKTSGEENRHTNVPSTLKDQTFKSRPSLSTRRKHMKISGKENKHPNCALKPKDQTFKSMIKTFKSKTNPEDEDQMRGLSICSFVTNIRNCA